MFLQETKKPQPQLLQDHRYIRCVRLSPCFGQYQITPLSVKDAGYN